MSESLAPVSATPRPYSARPIVSGGTCERGCPLGAIAPRAARRRLARERPGRADAPVPLAVPGPDALQLGRRAVRARAARVRHRQAPASPARLSALCRAGAPAEHSAGRPEPRVRLARHALQRRHHRDRLLAGARALRPRHRCVGGGAPGRQPALLVLWFSRADLRGRGVRRLAGRGLRRLALAAALMLGAVLSWFLPMVWLTGGLHAYLRASTQLYGSVVLPTSVLGGSLDVTLAQARYVLASVIVGLGPLALAVFALPLYLRRAGWKRGDWFLVAWIVPPAAFYTLVHFGQAGYVLTFLPALVILLSRVLMAALGDALLTHPRLRPLATTAVVTLVVLVNGSFFVSARPLPRD